MNWTRAKPRGGRRAGPKRRPWRALAIALAVAGAFFGIGYLVAVFVLFPPREASELGAPVPDLTGLSVEVAESDLSRLGLRLGPVHEIATPDEPPGVVVAQAPVAGQHLLEGAEVRLGVSTGAPERRVPDLSGMNVASASALLARLGAEVNAVQEPSIAVPEGRVTRSVPAVGAPLRAGSNVTLFVSGGAPAPPPDTGGDSMPIRP